MLRLKNHAAITLLLLVTALLPLPLYGADHPSQKAMNNKDAEIKQAPEYALMPDAGKKVPLGDGSYFIYTFDQKPKLGTLIMKVEIFNSKGQKDTSMEITGDAGMPAMKGAHETGDRPFVVSNKGAYLLPINIVMPGVWEIRLTVKKAGKAVFRGSLQFDV